MTARRAKHQIRVRVRGHLVHSSGTPEYRAAFARCRKEIKKAGVGAIGAVLELVRDPVTKRERMRPLYEARLVYGGKQGRPKLVAEDHTTPPPPHPDIDLHA